MELRHLRCFLAVAEELHFARAAERLHIEQSPLSRAIKELEEDLGVVLFVRTTRSTRLTRAGALFLEHVRRVFAALQQARDSVQAAANGFHGQLRVALSDGITPSRLPTLLALCRQEEPEVEIRFFEIPLSQQIKGLHDDLFDVGFAQSDEVGDGIVALPVWSDALMVAVPARHPLLAHKRIPLDELLRYPLVLCDPNVCESHAKHVERVLRRADTEPLVAERVASCDLMMALVSGGIALGLAGAAHIATSREPGVVARSLATRVPPLTTFLLRPEGEPSAVLARFIERVQAIDSPEPPKTFKKHHPAPPGGTCAMKKIVPFLLASLLTACGQSETPQKPADSAADIPTVEELAANPERLKELRQQCKIDRPKLGDVLCNRVAEATRKRFYGDGEAPYTPPKESPKF